MIEIESYLRLPEVIPQAELQAWRKRLRKEQAVNCPPEVIEFIEAIAEKMADFGRIRNYKDRIWGWELMLTNMKEFAGKEINIGDNYELDVPHMIAVDHRTWMHRIFKRRGKQGLIDYCRTQVNGTELQRTIEILEVAVFHNERPTFRKIMDEIRRAQKLYAQ
jgi:hypothetical protein